MRIAYLCFEDFSHETGVSKKICGQAVHWKQAGHDVKLVAPSMRGPKIKAAEELDVAEFDYPLGAKKYLTPAGMGIREVRNFCPDIIYTRYFILPPWHLSLAKQFPTILEVNSEESEFALYHSPAKRLMFATWRKQLQSAAAGAVFISHELSKKPEFHGLNHRIVIANGIDNDGTKNAHDFQRDAGPTRLFFIGNGNLPWHGTDKIVQIATLLPEVEIDVVGNLTIEQSPPNVTCHGPMPKQQYLGLLRRADVALGPLALHSKSISEASPLKVREYLSHGVPTIFAYKDTDISRTTPLTLHIPNTQNNVTECIELIASFIESSKGKRIQWNSVSTIDAARKERNRLVFFEKCAVQLVRKAG